MSSTSIQKCRGSENKQSMLNSVEPPVKDELVGPLLSNSLQGNFKRLETTIDTTNEVDSKRISSFDRRRRSSLEGAVRSTANVAQLNQTMAQIPSQQEGSQVISRDVLVRKGGSPAARSQRSASFDDRSGAHPFSVNESDLVGLGNDFDSAQASIASWVDIFD